MMELSENLYKLHEHEWMAKTPESNIYWLAWLVSEVGEVIDVVKKKGTDKIMNDANTRHEMLKEITDCYMHLADILNRYQFTAEEFSKVYRDKMNYNLSRDYSHGKTNADKSKVEN